MNSRVVPPGVLRHLKKLVRLNVVEYPEDARRPRTRGDCAAGERPCPWVSCRHHLAIEVTTKGNVRVDKRFAAHLEGSGPAPAETCALDVADRGGGTLEIVGGLFGFTRERVRQIEGIALRKARPVVQEKAFGDEPLSHDVRLPGRALRIVR